MPSMLARFHTASARGRLLRALAAAKADIRAKPPSPDTHRAQTDAPNFEGAHHGSLFIDNAS